MAKDVNKDISEYIHHHTLLVTTVVVAAFLLLAGGEYFLYRKIMWVSQMTAEGLMQIKEAKKSQGQVMMKGGRMMMRKEGEFKMMETNLMMPSGMRMMMDGTIIKPDGSRMKLGEGQMMEIE